MTPSRILPAALLLLASAPTALAAQGGEGGGGGLFDINAGLSVWTIVVFAALVFILGRFAWGPILSAVEAREEGIQSALDEARRRNAEAEKLLQEHKAQLADARRQASEIVAEGKVAGEKLRKELEEKARAEAQGIVERARAEIERERDKALDTVRREAVELALAAASRLLRENLDEEKDRAMVERFLDEVSQDQGAQA